MPRRHSQTDIERRERARLDLQTLFGPQEGKSALIYVVLRAKSRSGTTAKVDVFHIRPPTPSGISIGTDQDHEVRFITKLVAHALNYKINDDGQAVVKDLVPTQFVHERVATDLGAALRRTVRYRWL